MKFHQATTFEWQRHVQGTWKVPHHRELLKFLDLQAQASESTTHKSIKCSAQSMPQKRNAQQKPVYFANKGNSCTVCSGTTHPLYTCRKFRSLSHNQRLAVVKSNQLCFNCLMSGHLEQQCPSLQRCLECQKPHHTLFHLDNDRDAPSTTAGRRSPWRSCSPPAVTYM